jgi:cell wall-associated NlpC family hydrolase
MATDVVSIIVQVANQLGIPPALALAIAQQESGMDPNAVGGSSAQPSYGLFQLEVNGGEGDGLSMQQLLDPWTNAHVALSTVAAVYRAHPNWSYGDIAAAAQRPANPGAYAASVNALVGKYAGISGTAQSSYGTQIAQGVPPPTPPSLSSTVQQLVGQGTAGGQPTSAVTTNPAAASQTAALTDALTAYQNYAQALENYIQGQKVQLTAAPSPPPAPGNSVQAGQGVNSAVQAAMSQVGVPYAWGAESPGQNFDCSGLTQWAYQKEGISLPRTSEQQYTATARVAQPMPGDLVFMNFGEQGQAGPGHVGIYIGGGRMVDAPHTGANVRVENVPADAQYGRVGGAAVPGGAATTTAPAPTAQKTPNPSAGAVGTSVPTGAPTTMTDLPTSLKMAGSILMSGGAPSATGVAPPGKSPLENQIGPAPATGNTQTPDQIALGLNAATPEQQNLEQQLGATEKTTAGLASQATQEENQALQQAQNALANNTPPPPPPPAPGAPAPGITPGPTTPGEI